MADSPSASSQTEHTSQIYFKDKKGEIKGPFTERQVQEWYRQKWFDGAFPFYFMSNDEKPTDSAEFITLDDLRTRFGPCCPFQRVDIRDEGNRKDEMLKKLETLEKEISALQKVCEQARGLEQRVADVENRLQALETPAQDKENVLPAKHSVLSAIAAAEAAVAQPAAQPETKHHVAKSRYANETWYKELIDLVVESFEMLRGNNFKRADHIAKCAQMKKGQKLFENDVEEQGIFAEAVMEKMKKGKEYYHCARCDSYFLQPRQAFHHLMQYEHVDQLELTNPPLKKLTDAVVDLVNQTVMGWFIIESSHARREQNKYGRLSVACCEMIPCNDHIHKEIITKFLGGCGSGRRHSSNNDFFDVQIAKLKNGVDVKIEKALRAHIGNKQTFCDICDTVTGTVDEYFDHLRRFDHVMNMKLMHLPTIIANRLIPEE